MMTLIVIERVNQQNISIYFVTPTEPTLDSSAEHWEHYNITQMRSTDYKKKYSFWLSASGLCFLGKSCFYLLWSSLVKIEIQGKTFWDDVTHRKKKIKTNTSSWSFKLTCHVITAEISFSGRTWRIYGLVYYFGINAFMKDFVWLFLSQEMRNK